jgi:hypothetical protein
MTSEQNLESAPQRPFWDVDWRIMPRWAKWLIVPVMTAGLLVIVLDYVPGVTDWISDDVHSLGPPAIFAMLVLKYVIHYRAQRRTRGENRAAGE